MADISDVLASLMGGSLAAGPAAGWTIPGVTALGSGFALPGVTLGEGGGIPGVGGGNSFAIPAVQGQAFTMPGVVKPTAQAAEDRFNGVQKPAPRAPGAVPASVPPEYQGVIQEAAAKYGVDPALLAAQLKQESGFQNGRTSPAGAQGIAQFMPATARQYGVDVNDPRSSIDGMAHYMSDLLRQYNGDQRAALAAYNGGDGAVQRLRAGTPYGETQQYLTAVQRNLEAYRAENATMAGQTIAAAVTPSATGYVFPVQGYRGAISLHHGSVRGGSDIMAPEGTPVVAMRGGTVTLAGSAGPGGNAVQITGDDGLAYYYAHLRDTPMVRPGQQVQAGTPLGAVGRTGNAASTPPHLHIGIGPSIVTGVGPAGGTGGAYDAVALLQQALAAAAGQ